MIFCWFFCVIFEGACWHFGLTSKFCKNKYILRKNSFSIDYYLASGILHFESKFVFVSYSNLKFRILFQLKAIWVQYAPHFDFEFVSSSCSNFEFYGRQLYTTTECNCIVRYWHRSAQGIPCAERFECTVIHRWYSLVNHFVFWCHFVGKYCTSLVKLIKYYCHFESKMCFLLKTLQKRDKNMIFGCLNWITSWFRQNLCFFQCIWNRHKLSRK